jgi:hypothetical protein
VRMENARAIVPDFNVLFPGRYMPRGPGSTFGHNPL